MSTNASAERSASGSSRPSLPRKTKIIATIGPASREPAVIKELIQAGVNVFRLNFSHGSHESHLANLKVIRAASEELKEPIAVIQDLSGPKLRIAPVEDQEFTAEDGGEVTLVYGSDRPTPKGTVSIDLVKPHELLTKGDRVLLADGLIELVTVSVEESRVRCHVNKGGVIRSRVGIAFPDSTIDLPATTEKDFEDLKFGIEHHVDFVALSFVRDAEDIIKVKERIHAANRSIKVISKIEREVALENIEEILEVTDGLLVARGDLGIDLPVQQLPHVQNELIKKSTYRGVPVIIATEMLHSMISSLRPTRAEVTDIATAVLHGVDALMLSGETAIGDHPVTCVQYLDSIAREAENAFDAEQFTMHMRGADRETVSDAVSYAASAAARKVNASAIIACTATGNTARLVAKYRPRQPIFAVSEREDTGRQMALVWGTVPITIKHGTSLDEEVEEGLRVIQADHPLPPRSLVVITHGLLVQVPGATTTVEIRMVPEG